MEIKINRNLLLNHLQKVLKAISTKAPVETLTGVRFEVTENQIILTGSNMDITIQSSVSVNEQDKDLIIMEKGGYVLPAKQMIDIIRKLEGETLHILNDKKDTSKVTLRCGRSRFSLKTIEISMYPNIDMSADGICIPMTYDMLESIVTSVGYAVSNKETRPILTGVSIRHASNIVECTGTDSFRLARKSFITDQSDGEEFEIIAPSTSLREMYALLSENDKEFSLYISDRKIIMTSDDVIFQSRLISGNYPDVSRLIPDSFKYELKIRKSDLTAALDRISLLAMTGKGYAEMRITREQCILYTRETAYGSGEETIDSIEFNEDSFQIAFNCRYIQDILKTLQNDEVVIKFNGELKPFVVQEVGDSQTIHLVTPVRTH